MNKQIFFITSWIVVCLLVLVSVVYTDYVKYSTKLNNQQQNVVSELDYVHEDLERLLVEQLSSLDAIRMQIALNPELTQEELTKTANVILRGNDAIDFLVLQNSMGKTLFYSSHADLYMSNSGKNIVNKETVLSLNEEYRFGSTLFEGPSATRPNTLISRSYFESADNKGLKMYAEINLPPILEASGLLKSTKTNFHLKNLQTNSLLSGKEVVDSYDSRNIRVGGLSWQLLASPKGGWVPFQLQVQVWFLVLLFLSLILYNISMKRKNQLLQKQSELDSLNFEKRFRNFFEQHKVSMLVIDENNQIIDANASALSFYGYSLDTLKGKNVINFETMPRNPKQVEKPNQSSLPLLSNFELLLSQRQSNVFESKHQISNGEIKDVEVHLTPINFDDSHETLILIFDVTQKKQLDEKRMLFEQVFMHASEGILVTDSDKNIVSVNPSFEKITGFKVTEAIGRKPSMLSSGKHDHIFYEELFNTVRKSGEWRGEVWNKAKSGKLYPQILSISEVRNEHDQLLNYVAVFTDISEQKKVEKQLEELAHSDSLTGLPNRLMFGVHLERELKQAKRNKSTCAVLFLDLDRFKVINDSLGHDYGDKLLQMVSKRLQNCLRDTDLLARLGGDEYVILVNDCASDEDLSCLAVKLCEQLKQPFHFGNEVEANIDVSIGIAQYPRDASTAQELIKFSDASMYKAKNSRSEDYVFYSQEISERAKSRLNIKREIKTGISQKNFSLLLQPIIDLSNNKIMGAEALIRWDHPQKGLLLPDDFIPDAEHTGSMSMLTFWIVEQVYSFHQQLLTQGHKLKISFNVSAHDLNTPEFLDTLMSLHARIPGISESVTVEIVETALVENLSHASFVLQKLRKAGFNLAIDDFGTGFSSLAYLSQLPVNILKIDKVFVQNLHRSKEESIVRSIVSLANNFNLRVIGEGIETQEHEKALRDIGCDYGQGFYYSKAVKVDEFIHLCQSDKSMSRMQLN